jgi:chorismate mutase
MSAVRGIRGATTADANDKQSILDAAQELFRDLIDQNEVFESQVAAVFFTTTTDLNAEFPAQVVRLLGWMNSAMMCGHEMVVPDGLPMCLRILILVNTDKEQEEIQHVYLKGAIKLRARGLDQ